MRQLWGAGGPAGHTGEGGGQRGPSVSPTMALNFLLSSSHPVLTSWAFSYSEGFSGLQEIAFTFELEKEVGEGQNAAADHGDSAHKARVDQDEVALQGLWEERGRTS